MQHHGNSLKRDVPWLGELKCIVWQTKFNMTLHITARMIKIFLFMMEKMIVKNRLKNCVYVSSVLKACSGRLQPSIIQLSIDLPFIFLFWFLLVFSAWFKNFAISYCYLGCSLKTVCWIGWKITQFFKHTRIQEHMVSLEQYLCLIVM